MQSVVIVWIVLACVVLGAQAQVKTNRQEMVCVPTEALGRLSHGMSQTEVERLLGARGNHQFTALISNINYRCVAYYRGEIYGKYYLLFTNGHLSKVCKPPPFEMREIAYEGTWAVIRVLGDPEARIIETLAATDMIGPALVADLRPAKPPKQSWDPGLTAAFLLVKWLFGDRQREAAQRREWEALLVKYDPFAIELGMAREDVEGRLGKAQITEELGPERNICFYGNIKYGLMGSEQLMWLAVVYNQGRVVRVFSHDFVDWGKIRQLEEKAYGPKRPGGKEQRE